MERVPESTREAILVTAHRLMAGKGYTAVGINEVLKQAGVPKGSFYHYFESKDAFGEAVMNDYFTGYLADMDDIFARPDTTPAQRLMAYWRYWYDIETSDTNASKCLAVKLGAEVADLSEPMRVALKAGTTSILERVASVIDDGVADGTLSVAGDANSVARFLYDLWLGASVRAKIERDTGPLDNAMSVTRTSLGLAAT